MQGYSKKMTIVSVKGLLQDLGGHQPWGQVASEKAAIGLAGGGNVEGSGTQSKVMREFTQSPAPGSLVGLRHSHIQVFRMLSGLSVFPSTSL